MRRAPSRDVLRRRHSLRDGQSLLPGNALHRASVGWGFPLEKAAPGKPATSLSLSCTDSNSSAPLTIPINGATQTTARRRRATILASLIVICRTMQTRDHHHGPAFILPWFRSLPKYLYAQRPTPVPAPLQHACPRVEGVEASIIAPQGSIRRIHFPEGMRLAHPGALSL